MDSTKLATFVKVKEKLSLVSSVKTKRTLSLPSTHIFYTSSTENCINYIQNYKMLLRILCILNLFLQSQSFVIKFKNTEISSHKASNSEIFDAEEAAYFDAHDLSDAGIESAAMER